eukprot:TRINITY_DN4403_c4_g1_i1.p1 TRINITY_DN4403_c4_g1~~TRINITY_DN4403_c4_g1_i1.p1  ORF type:complete len:488 (+),score=88.35 TRINITY_DN4403_c4_g1_i1:88-1551(+)
MAAGSIKEFKRLLATPQARRIAQVAAKGAAGTCAAAVGLGFGFRELKQRRKQEVPIDFWSEVSFDVRGTSSSNVAAKSASAAVPALCERNGIAQEHFWAAASRLRPVEYELQKLHEGTPATSSASLKAQEDKLAADWLAKGYFEASSLQKERATLFGRRLTSDAQGVDIGVLVPPYLISQAGSKGGASSSESVPQAVQPAAWGGAATSPEAVDDTIKSWGAALLRGTLAPEDLAQLRCDFGLGGVASSAGKRPDPPRRAAEVGMRMQQFDPNVAMGRYTYGRLHILLRGSPTYEPPAVAVHSALAPLVYHHFRDALASGDEVFLSEAQLIVSDPCAEVQRWHVDSVGGPGLTAFIPLTSVTLQRGPQQILPGTHALNDSQLSIRERLRQCLGSLCATHGAVTTVSQGKSSDAASAQLVWNAGDALVLDSRTLHRGLGNDSLGAPVPLLVVRYDLSSKPPPGCRRSWLLWMTRFGGMLESLFNFYSAV